MPTVLKFVNFYTHRGGETHLFVNGVMTKKSPIGPNSMCVLFGEFLQDHFQAALEAAEVWKLYGAGKPKGRPLHLDGRSGFTALIRIARHAGVEVEEIPDISSDLQIIILPNFDYGKS